MATPPTEHHEKEKGEQKYGRLTPSDEEEEGMPELLEPESKLEEVLENDTTTEEEKNKIRKECEREREMFAEEMRQDARIDRHFIDNLISSFSPST